MYIKNSVSKWNYRKVYRNTKVYTLLLDRLNVPDLLENKLKTIKYLRNILEKTYTWLLGKILFKKR